MRAIGRRTSQQSFRPNSSQPAAPRRVSVSAGHPGTRKLSSARRAAGVPLTLVRRLIPQWAILELS